MIKFLGKVLVLIPFYYLLFLLFNKQSYPSSTYDFYFWGFLGLGFLGCCGILLNINKILSQIYILISFGCYCYFMDSNIFNLWPIGAILLLSGREKVVEIKKIPEKVSAVPEKVSAKRAEKVKKEQVVEKKPEKKEKVSVERVLDPIWSKIDRRKKEVIEDFWVRYDRKMNKNKPILIKFREKFNKLFK